MSEPKRPEAVKLFASIIFTDKKILIEVLAELAGQYGTTDFISPAVPFSYTDYYFREMGSPLERLFLSFAILIERETLPDIKLRTNDIEKRFSLSGRRRVNIDPAYMSRANLILATGKEYAHRPYLRCGIYADLTLIYTDKSFQPLPWTYPDYGERETREMLNKIREKYIIQIKAADKAA
ncbi:MAG: DUF4416 family protein [Syntrophales bacterium LBB04]|nr:DUF4416 family protein [Syntrophales bacterium LBB04]